MTVRYTTTPLRRMRLHGATPDHDLVVLGGGPTGVAAAERAVELGATVALVRPSRRRAPPSISTDVLRAAYAASAGAARSEAYGDALRARAGMPFDELRQHADRLAAAQTAAVESRLRQIGVEIIDGAASFHSAHELSVAGPGSWRVLPTRRTIVAVGARSSRPETIDFEGGTVIAADDLLSLERVPARLTIVGASAAGLEYASIFAALGSRVTLLEQEPWVSSFADDMTLDAMLAHLAAAQVEIRTSAHVTGVEREVDGTCTTRIAGQPPVTSRGVIWAAGRQASTAGIDLDRVGIALGPRGGITVDAHFATTHPDVFAAGSVVDGWMRANESALAGRSAASAALDCEPDEQEWPIARTLQTIPEIASVGPTSTDLEREGVPFVRGVALAGDLFAAEGDDAPGGLLELFVSPGDRTLLAAHAFGVRAQETIHIAQLAIGLGVTVDALAHVPFCHPSFCEAYQVAANDAANVLPAPAVT